MLTGGANMAAHFKSCKTTTTFIKKDSFFYRKGHSCNEAIPICADNNG